MSELKIKWAIVTAGGLHGGLYEKEVARFSDVDITDEIALATVKFWVEKNYPGYNVDLSGGVHYWTDKVSGYYDPAYDYLEDVKIEEKVE